MRRRATAAWIKSRKDWDECLCDSKFSMEIADDVLGGSGWRRFSGCSTKVRV